MILIRIIVLVGLKNNIDIKAKFVCSNKIPGQMQFLEENLDCFISCHS